MSNHTFNNKDLFLEPKVNQYGSHMVMTNVKKPNKIKHINFDTKFSDEFNNEKIHETTNYTFTLPERLTNVKSISIMSVELPMSFYNISRSLGNSFFKINSEESEMLVLNDGNYTLTSLINSINDKLLASNFVKDVSCVLHNEHFLKFGNKQGNTNTYRFDFDTDICGNFDKYHFRSKLGWLLGYRNQSHMIQSHAAKEFQTPSEAFINLNNVNNYLYLVLDEFNNGVQNSFISPLNGYLMNKKILARIGVDKTLYPFGSVLHSYENLGSLLSDVRYYSGGKIDIQKLNIQIVNEYGIPIYFNGCDFSFVLKVEFE